MNDEPLIWTSKGNVPLASLTYAHQWIDNEDRIVLMESWTDASGELVKNNVHMLAKKQLTMGGEQAVMA
jgi:hypothetical protein